MCLSQRRSNILRWLRNGVGLLALASSLLEKASGMSRTVLLLSSTAVTLLLASGAILALPSERPDKTPMVDGRVRAIKQVGTNTWLGGTFTKVKKHKGTVMANVSNLAVVDSKTKRYKNIAPKLGGKDSEVWDMARYGEDVLIAGIFSGPSGKGNNLVRVDGKTGRVIEWFEAPPLKSILGAPDLGRVYGGGESLSAFEAGGSKKRPLWSRAKIIVDKSLHDRVHEAAYRDLERDGKTIWAACVCDAVNGKPAKALIKLSTEGVHDASWVTKAAADSYGHEVVDHNGKLYLAAGGSDFLAELDKGAGGRRSWVRDTMGSAQAVTVMGEQLVVGGHFLEVADHPNDDCGRRLGDQDPNDECRTRKGIAAYSLGGQLDPDWHPAYSGSYSLVWELHVEGDRLHTGGEFKKVSGVTQNSYARLSPDSIEGNERPNTLLGTSNDDAIYGYGGADRIDGWGGDDTLHLGGGSDRGRGGRGNDQIRAVDGSKDDIYCGSGSDRVKANPGDNVSVGCERVIWAGRKVG
jgi:RTX calcium-binding nonapeptide repeat (4 copies)